MLPGMGRFLTKWESTHDLNYPLACVGIARPLYKTTADPTVTAAYAADPELLCLL